MWLMLQQPKPDDYVVATGETHSVRDLVEQAFTEVGLDWKRHVEIDNRYLRPTEVDVLQGDAAKARKVLGWHPRNAFTDLIAMMIAGNLVEASRRAGVKKLLFLGSSCIYPRLAPQPMREEALLTGPLEPTNQWYAVAKIAGLKLCAAYRRQYGADFISAQPTNLYGPGDTYDLQASHVVPALMARTHHAKVTGAAQVEIWGTGTPKREFLHVDDLADALVFLMERYSEELQINIAWGQEVSIRELAELIAEVVGYTGGFRYATEKPDGTPRKLLDVSRLKPMGWRPPIPLRDGLPDAYRWFVDSVGERW